MSVCVGVSVCLCVCLHICDEIAELSNTVLSEAITLDNSSILQHYHDDLIAGFGSYGSFIQNHILAYNFKTDGLMYTKFVAGCSLARGTFYMLRILRSIDKSKSYGHLKQIGSVLKNQVPRIFIQLV